MITLQDQLERTGFRSTGFDYLRPLLALGVVIWHSVLVVGGPQAEIPYWSHPVRIIVFNIVPAFFALGGFLIAGSIDRNPIPSFLALRSLRIFPALIVEVCLSALLIGPLTTILPLADYFSDPTFFTYLLNAIGYTHYYLPGVFTDLPAAGHVNIQLWTIPIELYCYGIISILALFRIHRFPRSMLAILLAISTVVCLQTTLSGDLWNFETRPRGDFVALCFFFGINLYTLRQVLPWNLPVFALCLTAGSALIWMPETFFLAPFFVAYATIYLGLLNPAKPRFMQGTDYSYGIYLYGFPVQQTICHLLPAYRTYAFNVSLSLLVTCILAVLSWHLIEGPAMNRRHGVIKAIAALLDRLPVWLQQLLLYTPENRLSGGKPSKTGRPLT